MAKKRMITFAPHFSPGFLIIAVLLFNVADPSAANDEKELHYRHTGDDDDEEHSRKKRFMAEDLKEHPVNWSGDDQHGEYAEHRGTKDCMACHGADLRGSEEAPSCFTCHKNRWRLKRNWRDD